MKLRFSLRMLLVATIVAAAAAAFVALRMQPAKMAAKLQDAVRRKHRESVAALLQGPGIEQTLTEKGEHVGPESWEFISCEVDEQSVSQWLQGECSGRFIVEFHFRSEGNDSIFSAYQESQYEVSASASGVQIVNFSQQQPLTAVIPKLPEESNDAELPASN